MPTYWSDSTPTIELGDGTSLAGDIVAFNVIDDLALIRVHGADFKLLLLGPAEDGTVGAVFGWSRSDRRPRFA